MKRQSGIVFVAMMLVATVGYAAPPDTEQTAQQIMDRVTSGDNLGIGEGEARTKLTIYNKRGQKRERMLNSKSLKVKDLRWTVVTFIEPDDVAGTRLLSKEVKDGDDLQYLYLPAMKEKRRIAGSAKNESFMGTDFTYNDLEQSNIENAKYTKLPDEKHSDIDCFVIEAIPTDKDSEYSKVKVWVDKKDFISLKIYFYDGKGELLKKMIAQMIEPIDGKLTITKLLMKNVQKGSKTTMEIMAMDRKKTFPKAIFDEKALGN